MAQGTFLDVLSTKHRLFLVQDMAGGIHWLGMGQNKLEICFTRCCLRIRPSHFTHSPRMTPGDLGEPERERLDLYLKANGQYFADSIKNGVQSGPACWTNLQLKRHVA